MAGFPSDPGALNPDGKVNGSGAESCFEIVRDRAVRDWAASLEPTSWLSETDNPRMRLRPVSGSLPFREPPWFAQ